MVIVSVMLIIFLLLAGVIAARNAELNKKQTQQAFEQVALELETELRLASSTLPGYVRVFELPTTIRGWNYRIGYKVSGGIAKGMVVESQRPGSSVPDYFASLQVPAGFIVSPASTGANGRFRVETKTSGIELIAPGAANLPRVELIP